MALLPELSPDGLMVVATALDQMRES
jgi:hypothetical protein